MKEFTIENAAIEQCMNHKNLSIAHLYNSKQDSDMHVHDCYEIHYFVSGGKHMLIDQNFYTVNSGDIFFINPYEGHALTLQSHQISEQIIFYIHPDFLKALSSPLTDLSAPFLEKKKNHRISLSIEQRTRFLQGLQKMTASYCFAADIYEKAAFLELMAMLCDQFISSKKQNESTIKPDNQVPDILNFINDHIKEPLSIDSLAEHFYLSESYICRLFKNVTGTTINKYITIRRITIAKKLLADDYSVTEACEQCGFTDYSNFFKAFTKAVKISPKKYAQTFSAD